jgi:hypothetical protein
MECRYRVLIRCPKCLRVFCVPELVGSSVVWHEECDAACDRVPCSDAAEHVDRSPVVFDRDANRLELRCGAARE